MDAGVVDRFRSWLAEGKTIAVFADRNPLEPDHQHFMAAPYERWEALYVVIGVTRPVHDARFTCVAKATTLFDAVKFFIPTETSDRPQ